MPKRFNSIKYKILSGFIFLTLNMVFLSSLSFYYLKRAEKIRILDEKLDDLRISTLKLIKLDIDFLNYEIINNEFYIGQKSSILSKRDVLFGKILKENRAVRTDILEEGFQLNSELNKLEKTLENYNHTLKQIIIKVLTRGFKDHGLEGELRFYAHKLEKDVNLDKVQVLSLRRHEKDYFLRNDEEYKSKLNSLVDTLKGVVKADAKNNKTSELLDQYRITFNKLSGVQEEIGFHGQKGLKNKLNILGDRLNEQFNVISAISKSDSANIIHKGTVTYLFTVLLSIALSLFISYVIAIKLSRPIRKLSGVMDKFMTTSVQDGNEDKGITEEKRRAKKIFPKILSQSNYNEEDYSDEIRNLSKSFINLLQHTRKQFNEIQEKSELLREQNEELTKVNKELDHFVYSAAHDLRSPLTSLLGLIELSQSDQDPEMRHQYLGYMKQSISRLDGFIKDIVNYSKNSRMELQIEDVNLQEIVEECLDIHRYASGTDNITKVIDIKSSSSFYCDKRRLGIILNNFISNAYRYSDLNKHQPSIVVKGTVDYKEAWISIKDNGIGISEEHHEKIFTMFYRASEISKGSGLGLFIVKETVNKLGGRIEFSSTPGEGTEFILRLPNKILSNRLIESK